MSVGVCLHYLCIDVDVHATCTHKWNYAIYHIYSTPAGRCARARASMRAFVCGVCVSVNLTCESSEMEFDATVEVADEWLTVEALDTAAVAVHAQHRKHANKKT